MEGPYAALTFESQKDFDLYRKSVGLLASNIALSKDYKLVALISTDVLIPSGILTTKTRHGEEITIRVSSGYANEQTSK